MTEVRDKEPHLVGRQGGPPRLTKGQLAWTVALYRRLKNTNRVGAQLGISGAAVRYRLSVAGEPYREQGRTAGDPPRRHMDPDEMRTRARMRSRRYYRKRKNMKPE